MDRGDDNGLRDELADDGPSGGGRAGERLAVLQYPLLQPAPAARLQRKEVVANAALSLLGVGLLAMPAAMARAGLVTGALVVAATAACMQGSLKLLLATGASVSGSKVISYPELARQALGPQGLAAVLICHLLYSGGLLTADLVALADLVGQLLQSAGAAAEDPPRVLCVLVALSACTFSAVFVHRRANAVLSAACMTGVMFLIAALLAVCLADIVPGSSEEVPPPTMLEDEDVQEVSVDVALFRWNLGGLLAAAALATSQLALHPGCFEVLRDDAGMATELQENDSHGEEGVYMEGFGNDRSGGACAAQGARPRSLDVEGVIRSGFLAATSLVIAVGAAGYLRFGNLVAGDVLSSFHVGYGHQGAGMRAAAVLGARLVYGLTLTIAAPFVIAPCRATSLELFAIRRGVGGPSVKAARRAYAGVLAVTGLLAWLIEDLTMPLSFVGAWAAGPLALTLPTLISWEVSKQQARSSFTSANIRSIGFLVLGVLLMLGSLVSTIIMVFQQPAGHEGHRILVHNTLDFNMPDRNFTMGDNSIASRVIRAPR